MIYIDSWHILNQKKRRKNKAKSPPQNRILYIITSDTFCRQNGNRSRMAEESCREEKKVRVYRGMLYGHF